MSDRLALANAIEDAGIERIKATKADVHAAIERLRHDLTMRGLAGLIAAGGILSGALHLWPPHG